LIYIWGENKGDLFNNGLFCGYSGANQSIVELSTVRWLEDGGKWKIEKHVRRTVKVD